MFLFCVVSFPSYNSNQQIREICAAEIVKSLPLVIYNEGFQLAIIKKYQIKYATIYIYILFFFSVAFSPRGSTRTKVLSLLQRGGNPKVSLIKARAQLIKRGESQPRDPVIQTRTRVSILASGRQPARTAVPVPVNRESWRSGCPPTLVQGQESPSSPSRWRAHRAQGWVINGGVIIQSAADATLFFFSFFLFLFSESSFFLTFQQGNSLQQVAKSKWKLGEIRFCGEITWFFFHPSNGSAVKLNI